MSDTDADFATAITRANYHGPRDLDEWLSYLKENTDKSAFIDAEKDAVFVAWNPEEEMWRSNSTDQESGNRSTSYTHANLVERWFREGFRTDGVWPLDRDNTPIREVMDS